MNTLHESSGGFPFLPLEDENKNDSPWYKPIKPVSFIGLLSVSPKGGSELSGFSINVAYSSVFENISFKVLLRLKLIFFIKSTVFFRLFDTTKWYAGECSLCTPSVV